MTLFKTLLGGLSLLSLTAAPLAAQTAGQTAATSAPAPTATPATPIPSVPQDARVGPYGIPAATVDARLSDPNNRGPVAVVNGAVITGTDLAQRVALLVSTSEGEMSGPELQQVRLQVLSNLIDETLQIQAAAAQELAVESRLVEGRYAEVAGRNFQGATDAARQMDAQLMSLGSSPNSLKRQITGEIAWQLLLRRNITPFINVSEEEARERLAALEATRGSSEYRIGEIYLSATPESRAAVFQNASAIVEQLRKGGNFVAYARQFSEATTATVGGDLGFVQLNRLPPEMAREVGNMEAGQLVGPVEVPGGFTIILLIDKKQVMMADPRDSILSLKQIAMGIPDGMSAAEFDAGLAQFNSAIGAAGSCEAVDAIAAGIGAEVVPNSQVRARSLPGQLQSALLSMQPGQATPAFGSQEEGVRVLMLCGRQAPPQEAAQTVAQIQREIEDERVEKRAQAFLRDLRNDADIQYN